MPMQAYGSYADWKRDQSAKNKRLIGALERVIGTAAPELTKTVKWGQGCFTNGPSHRIYIHAAEDHVQLGFYEGATLQDPDGLLAGKGKHVRHVRVETAGDVRPDAFTALIQQVSE
jgi:hypothetical protein